MSNPIQAPVLPKESVIVLRFAGPGAAEFAFEPKNVTPAQMMIAGAWLSARAAHLFNKSWNEIESQADRNNGHKIVVPQVMLPNDVRSAND